MTQEYPLWLIPALPLAGAAINLIAGRFLARRMVHLVAVGVVAASFVAALVLVAGPLWKLFQEWQLNGGQELSVALFDKVFSDPWIQVGDFKIELAFRMDTLTAVMVLVVTFVGLLIHIYSTGYMSEEPRYATYFGYLNLFTGSMLILVLGNNLPVMFIGWEGVGLCSYLLIGFWFTEEAFAYAGRKAFVVNRIGDFAFLLGMCLLFWAVGTLDFAPAPVPPGGAQTPLLSLQSDQAIQAYLTTPWADERLALFAGLLLFIGACGKSAQIPLYVWLPDAMAGPTPVSALIHAATMVTAGVYMVARMSFLYAHSGTAMAIVAGVGALTALFAAIIAFAQTDLKRVLAYSTVSQLGFMFVGVGVGAYSAGIFHLVTHAFFKAGLFLGAGSVMHAMSGSGDITKMGGLRKKLPFTHAAFAVYWLAICGIFPFAGFFSKDEILAGAFGASAPGWVSVYGEILWAVLSLAALGTAFYMSRLYFLVFAGESRADAETQAHIHESPASMTVPLVLLAAFTIVLGCIGLPHLSLVPHGVQNIIGKWLDPSLINFDRPSLQGGIHEAHFSDTSLGLLMLVALAIGVVGIAAAAALYRRGPSGVVDRFTMGAGAELYRVVKNKFYVDELYDRIIVRPFRAISQAIFEVIDRFVIDWIIVDGSAFVVDLFGRAARWFQNGQVQRYLVAVVVGGALIVFFATRTQADFDWWQSAPLTAEFEVDVGSGPGSSGATAAFDFTGDGVADWTGVWKQGDPPLHATWKFTRPGQHEVTMRLTDAVFEKQGEVSQTVTVEADAQAAEVADPQEGAAAPPAPVRSGGGEP